MFLRQIFKNATYKDIPITAPMSLGSGAVEILPLEEGGAKAICYDGVEVCGVPEVGERILFDDSLIRIVPTKEIYIFKDEEERERRRLLRLQKASTIEGELPAGQQAKIREEVEALYEKFRLENEKVTTLKTFSLNFCRFAQEYCNFDRAIFFKVVPLPKKVSLVPVSAVAPEKTYLPSKTIMLKLYKTGEPVYVITKELVEEDLSVSILQHKIKTVLGFPIYNKAGKGIAVFYADATHKEISAKNFLTISYLCNKVAEKIETLLPTPSVKAVEKVVAPLTPLIKTPHPAPQKPKLYEEGELDDDAEEDYVGNIEL